jgi:hypothetical protein
MTALSPSEREARRLSIVKDRDVGQELIDLMRAGGPEGGRATDELFKAMFVAFAQRGVITDPVYPWELDDFRNRAALSVWKYLTSPGFPGLRSPLLALMKQHAKWRLFETAESEAEARSRRVSHPGVEPPPPPARPETALDQRRLLADFWRVFDELAPGEDARAREVLARNVRGELTAREAAKLIGCADATVPVRKRRALAAVRDAFAARGYDINELLGRS